MRKLLFIFNPHSGTGKIRAALSDIIDIFTESGYEVTIYPTRARRDGSRKVLESGPQYDRIVVAGGDGMFHELTDAVLRLPSPVPVGYLPAGTVNDFAAAHALPGDLRWAAEIAVSDNIAVLDAGKFNDGYFSYIAAFGLLTQVSYTTNQEVKNRLGGLAYALEVLQSIDLPHFNAACRRMTIDTESDSISGEFVFGAVTNSTSVAGMKNFIKQDVKFDDGVLEGLFIRKPASLLELEQMKIALVNRDFTAPGLIQIQARRFRFRSERTAWTLDGEDGGEHSDVEISAAERALHIALPEGGGSP